MKVPEKGFETASIWGRYLRLNDRVIVDAAHNLPGIEALIQNLKKDFPNTKPAFLVGIQKNKDVEGMINAIQKIAGKIYYCAFDPMRTRPFPLQTYQLGAPLPDDPLLVITGSIYFIAHWANELR